MCGCHGIGLRKIRADIVWVAAQWIMCQSLGRTIRKRWGNGDFWLGWFFFFFPLTVQDVFFFAFDRARCFFFSTTTLSNFFWICFLPFACAWRVCAGPLCGDLPSLDWTVQRKRLQSVDVDACIRMAFTSLQPLFWFVFVNLHLFCC